MFNEQDSSMRDSINKEYIVLRHMDRMSELICGKDANVNSYSLVVKHLLALLGNISENKEFLVELANIDATRERGILHIRKSAKNRADTEKRMEELNGAYSYALFTAINKLTDRMGLGWRKKKVDVLY